MEIVTSESLVKKPSLDEDDKVLIGQKLGAILKKYPTNAKIRNAGLPVTASLFEPLSKTSTKGCMVEVTGNLEKIDIAQNRLTIDGRGYKISAVCRLTVPPEFDGEDEYSDSGWSDSVDKPSYYEGDHFTDDDWTDDPFPPEGEPVFESRIKVKRPSKTILYHRKGA